MNTNAVLHQAPHGADKKQVLERIDALQTLIMAAQSGSMFREQALEEAQLLVEKPFKKVVLGFREEDVQQYLLELMNAI